MAGRSRSFGPVVLAGLASGTLVAVAGNQAWASLDDEPSGASEAIASVGVAVGEATAPLVTALALVLLAAWGVVLVSRGVFRRAVVWLGLVAAIGTLVAAVATWLVAPTEVREAFAPTEPDVSRTAWAYVAVLLALVAVAASVAAVLRVRSWPEMGRRYDAPGEAVAPPSVPVEEQSNLDLWRALDEGRDPTG